MHWQTARSIVVLCIAIGTSLTTPSQTRGGRYDLQIRGHVAQIIAGSKDYKNVKAEVDDGIVTLTGDVELHSLRRALVARVHRVPHVMGVENQVVLLPAPEPDHVLYGRVQSQLQDAGFGTLSIQVHEGNVTLRGTVGNRRDLEAARRVVSMTPGVKEVESKVSVASP